MWTKFVHLFINTDYRKKEESAFRKAKLICSCCLLTAIFAVLYTIISTVISFKAGIDSQAVTFILLVINALLFRTRIPLKILGNIYIGICFQTIAILPFFSGGINSIILPWLALVPAIAILLLDKYTAWVWFALSALVIISYATIHDKIATPIQYDKSYTAIFFTIVLIGLGLIILIVNNVFENNLNTALKKLNATKDDLLMTNHDVSEKNEELLQQKEEILQQRDTLEEITQSLNDTLTTLQKKNRDIIASINYAKRIQEATLPSEEKLNQLLRGESTVFFQPKDQVSGDFYWIEEMHGKVFIAAADCTGHGVPGAFMSMIGNSMLTNIIKNGTTSPNLILDELSIRLKNKLQRNERQVDDGMDIGLCAIDFHKNKIEFSGAAHSLIRVNNENEITEIKGDKIILGYNYKKTKKFTLKEFSLSKDENFYMFSDGYKDQFGGPENYKFSPKRLKKLLQEIHTYSPLEQKNRLKENFLNWKGKNKQIDDVMVIGWKFN